MDEKIQSITLIPNNSKVTISNDLVEAHYPTDIRTLEHKILRLVYSFMNPRKDGEAITDFVIRIDKLKSYLSLSPDTKWNSLFGRLKEVQARVNKFPLEIYKDGELISTSILPTIALHEKNKTIRFSIGKELRDYLTNLDKNYTSYRLINIPKLRSGYSIRIYELLFQYKKIGLRYFEIDDLQKKVGSKYKLYGDFKRKVLNQAQKDLKKHTDLAFAFAEKKAGRKVIGVEFVIFGNTPEKKPLAQLSFFEDAIKIENKDNKPALPSSIIESMNELGISEQNIAKYLAIGFKIVADKENRDKAIKRCQTLENYYLEKLELAKQSTTKGNAAGFFIKALKEDWTTSKTVTKAKAIESTKKRSAAKKELEKLSKRIVLLSKKKKAVITPIIEELIKNDTILKTAYDSTIGEMGKFIKSHISTVLHLPIKEQYEQSIHISSGVVVYLMEHYSKRFTEANVIDTQIEQTQQNIQDIKKKYPAI